MWRISIRPSEKSIAPDVTGQLPSKTTYYIWRAQQSCTLSGDTSSRDAVPKAVLILQHDHAEYARRYLDGHHLKLFSTLREQGVELWAFDVWGHGLSKGSRGIWDVRKAVKDHLALRNLIAAEAQEKSASVPVFLFGHGYGGLVTSASLLTSGTTLAPVAGVILSAPIIKRDGLVKRAALTIANCCCARARTFDSKIPLTALSRDLEQVDFYLDDPLRYDGNFTWRVRATAASVTEKVYKRIEDWTVPTLLFNGTEDIYVSAQQMSNFFSHIACADKQHVVTEGGKHELLRDLGHQKLENEVVGWIEKRL